MFIRRCVSSARYKVEELGVWCGAEDQAGRDVTNEGLTVKPSPPPKNAHYVSVSQQEKTMMITVNKPDGTAASRDKMSFCHLSPTKHWKVSLCQHENTFFDIICWLDYLRDIRMRVLHRSIYQERNYSLRLSIFSALIPCLAAIQKFCCWCLFCFLVGLSLYHTSLFELAIKKNPACDAFVSC